MDRPGGLLAVKAEGADEKTARQLAPLKEERIARFGKYQRHSLHDLEPRMFQHFNLHKVTILRRKERMKYRMTGEDILEIDRRLSFGIGLRLGFKPQFPQSPANHRRDAVDQQDDAASVRKVTP